MEYFHMDASTFHRASYIAHARGDRVPTGRKYVGSVDEKAIGARLRQLRQQRGLTQAEVAGGLGIDQSLISEYERGVVRLHGSLIIGLAKLLKVSTDQLLGVEKLKNGDILGDRRFLRRLLRTEKLSRREKQLLLGTIDKFLKGAGVA
jgi:transcriptional regulator with XRE-family HTH domain